MVKSRDIAQSLFRLIDDGENPEDVVESFFDFARRNNLSLQLEAVLRHVECIAEQRNKEERVSLVFAREPSKKLVDRIKQYVRADKNAEIHIEIDNNILGGFIATYKGEVFNASISNQIQKLKSELV